MRDTLDVSLSNLKWMRIRNNRMTAALLVLSLLVTGNVFWFLRQPGLTLAGDASCGIVEHTHDEACGTQICICTIPEEPHSHADSCYTVNWVEEQETRQLACDVTEDPHIHSDGCYGTVTKQSKESVLTCDNQDEEHTHEDGCFETVVTDSWEETELVCNLVSEPHRHTDDCFVMATIEAHEERVLTCELSEEGHAHDEACYAWDNTCELEEHVHSIDCYSDDTADVETMLDWQNMFAGYPYTENLRENLVGIAKMQVGYAESTSNFEVGSDGVRRGYTRYGAWYGTPYRDWSAMFVSFCLHYAGADPDDVPGNTGAASMVKLWKQLDKYASREKYTPLAGDLAFFRDNTVGIVTEVQNATCYIIRGDVDDAVRSERFALTDKKITGWGVTEGTVPHEEEPVVTEAPTEVPTEAPTEEPTEAPTEESTEIPAEVPVDEEIPETEAPTEPDPEPERVDLLDISNGPAFFIFEGGQVQPQMQRYSLRNTRAIIDLLPYLEAHNGNYFFTLLDFNNVELPKDENGNYIATAGTGYKITLTFNSPEGFLPGTYQYQIPNGLMVDGGDGTFILKDGTNVGSWVVTDTGLITLVFNENINTHTDITISSTLGIHFPEQEDPIDFDGKITVTVEKPPPQTHPTYMNKWGNQGGVPGAGGTDPTKIYWELEIIGNKDSQIPGSILTDRIIDGEWSKTHKFTESDIAGGLTFGVADPYGGWHAWTVPGDDPHLIWTEKGWSYKMPTTAICQWCGEIELGNEGWYYYIDYSSTPDRAGTAGTFGYENDATIDGAYGYAWVNFTHGETTGEIVKNGAFVSDAGGGSFRWEFRAIIPGRADGQKADYHWYIMDNMGLLDGDNQYAGRTENDAHLAAVYATYQGTTVQIPRIQDATANDMLAYDNAWTATENGINYGREFNLLHRCQCTPDTCFWGNGCDAYWYQKDDGEYAQNGFCQCWTPTEEIVFTFVYETDAVPLVDRFGGMDYKVMNEANLYYKPDGVSGALVSSSDATLPIPGVFKKELTQDFNGYTANYKVTVNESKLMLTDGSPLFIRDEMTDTLAYISGSLVIITEDANGNLATLQQGTDYTVTYDGTGGQTDTMGKPVHVLEIVILHPQPVMYILDYDTTLIMPEHVTGAIKYSNSATITLWGESISDNAVEKTYADINISSKSFKVELYKTCALTKEPLGGATFGLYNAQGGLITTDVTDAKGKLLFQTSIVEGIILREHIPYYMQELRAPPGYQLDDTPYWFCFCDTQSDHCAVCDEVLAGLDAVRIPFEEIGKVHITNQLMHYDLPATGGMGVYPLILVGVIFIMIPLVYISIRGRKQERRGVG